MSRKYLFAAGFIISVVFSVSFLITAILSLLNPETATEMLRENSYFSWMTPMTEYLVHVGGNIFFTAVAIFFSQNFWKRYIKET